MTIALAGPALCASAASASSWYVDGVNGGSQYSAGSAAAPFMYLWEALQHTQPGDTVYVVPSMTYPQLPLMTSGTALAAVTLAGSDPAKPTKVSGGGVASGIWINGNYVVVKNFDVTAPGNYAAVSIAPHQHHVTIDSNVIHDAGGNGINTLADDYITVSNNTVYGNAKLTNQSFSSGISFLGSVAIDAYTGTKMRIKGNFIYLNTNTPNCATPACYAAALDSDGSGIILDDNQRKQFDNVPYTGAFLISNNVIFRNGGRGVHIYRTDNVVVTGNTMYQNNQDPYEGFWHPGEVSAAHSNSVRIVNNILSSDGLNSPNHTGTAPNYHVALSFEYCTDNAGPLIAQGNVGFNPQADATKLSYAAHNTNPVTISGNAFADPLLSNPALADFWFRTGSPAYRSAALTGSVGLDILGVQRGAAPSIGAYQNPAP